MSAAPLFPSYRTLKIVITMKLKHVFPVISSLALICTLPSCKDGTAQTTEAPTQVRSYSSSHSFEESDFSEWMSKADQQIAYEKRDKNTYFAFTEGRSLGGFQQYRHVIRPLPLETHSEWAVYWGLSSDDFYPIDLKLQKAGFERKHLQVYEDGSGESYYQAVWLKKK